MLALSQESHMAAEGVIDQILTIGGRHFYEKFLESKRNKHTAKRTIQLFEESTQVLPFTFSLSSVNTSQETQARTRI